jgi:hypothetical protein
VKRPGPSLLAWQIAWFNESTWLERLWRRSWWEYLDGEQVGSTALFSRALRAICLTRDYVGEQLLPAIEGWEWYDAGVELMNAIPDDEWAEQFRLRTQPGKGGRGSGM